MYPNLNLMDEQKRQLQQLFTNVVIMLVVGLLTVFTGYKFVVEPQLAAQAARHDTLRGELALEPVQLGGIGTRAVPYNISANPVRVKQSNIDAFVAWNGSDIKLYSDGGTTAQFTVDGATGNTFVNGFARLGAAATISVTNGSIITPTATYQPIQSAGTVTATAVATTDFSAGQIVTLINTSNTSIILTNGTNLKLPSASNLTLGQYDAVVLWFDGTRWIAVANENN